MSHVLIVGQKFSSLTDYLLINGHEYTFLQDVLKTKYPDKKFKNRVVADFSTRTNLLASLSEIKKPIDGVIATYENYVLAAAWISEHLGVPGIPIPAAEACTDKTLMRTLFANAPEKISPDFQEVSSEAELLQFASDHQFPLILKPANLSKSLLVTKNHNEDELITNYRKSVELISSTYLKYAPNRTPKLIVEEFLDGSIHSVDAFVDSNGQPNVLHEIVDYKTGYDIGYDDNFHYSRLLPTKMTKADQEALRHCAEVGIRALGMKSSPAHVEIIMTNDGPRIVEIGARNGGYRERMHMLANNIDITGAALALALGAQPNVIATSNIPCAVLELFPQEPGLFKGLSCEQELRKLPSLQYLSIKPSIGHFVGKSADGHKMCAVVILGNSDVTQFEKDLSFVNQDVAVQTTS